LLAASLNIEPRFTILTPSISWRFHAEWLREVRATTLKAYQRVAEWNKIRPVPEGERPAIESAGFLLAGATLLAGGRIKKND
jgi:hypothetical protein